MDFRISFAITACNEHRELEELLSFIIQHKRPIDEVVVQFDSGSVTQKVRKTLNTFKDSIDIVGDAPLDNDFGAFKNNLNQLCTADYIFQLDADELPSLETVGSLHLILEANPEVDLFLVPRVNTVEGLTKKHLKKWKWNLNERDWVNWPDYQPRIFKNLFNIKWINKVHETISGHSAMASLPPERKFAILHRKDIGKQEKQNNYYETLTP